MRAFRTKVAPFLPLVVGLLTSGIFFFYLSPESIVEYIGLENAYLLMYVIATLGGMTTFNTIPYFSVIMVLATAGVNPILLGISSALGVMTGDSFSYYVGHQGAAAIPGPLRSIFASIYQVALHYPKLFPIVCFLYGAISPLSNDFITIPAGMAKIPYTRVMIPLGCGNIVFNITFAYLCIYAYEWVQAIFIG